MTGKITEKQQNYILFLTPYYVHTDKFKKKLRTLNKTQACAFIELLLGDEKFSEINVNYLLTKFFNMLGKDYLTQEEFDLMDDKQIRQWEKENDEEGERDFMRAEAQNRSLTEDEKLIYRL